jgi:hypothetical protein
MFDQIESQFVEPYLRFAGMFRVVLAEGINDQIRNAWIILGLDCRSAVRCLVLKLCARWIFSSRQFLSHRWVNEKIVRGRSMD